MSRKRFPAILDLTIESIDAEGIGFAPLGEKSARVKGGLPGESLSARTVGRRKGAALAVAQVVVANASSQTQAAPCEVFPRCGGCALQHMTYEAQLELKQQGLLGELAAAGVAFDTLRAPVASPQFGYRRKARLGVRKLDELQLVGFRETFGGRVVKMDRCLALAQPFDGLIGQLAALVAALSAPAAIPQIETAVGDNQTALIIRHLERLTPGDVKLLDAFQTRHDLSIYTQSKGYDTVTALSEGVPLLNYSLPEFGLNLEFSVTDFIQVNRHINAALVRSVAAALQSDGPLRVADMFCGIGNFSLPLARRGHQVSGWEAAGEAIDRARSNARRNGLAASTKFHVADLYGQPGDKKLKTPVAEITGMDALVLDPPRSGAGPALVSWLDQPLRKVVYVSCNPTTFASDARTLVEQGFKLAEVGIYDMFPHTAHVETLGVFERHG